MDRLLLKLIAVSLSILLFGCTGNSVKGSVSNSTITSGNVEVSPETEVDVGPTK